MFLKQIVLQIRKCAFVYIIGKIGSDKSSLLSTLIGDLLQVSNAILKPYMGQEGYQKELNQEEA